MKPSLRVKIIRPYYFLINPTSTYTVFFRQFSFDLHVLQAHHIISSIGLTRSTEEKLFQSYNVLFVLNRSISHWVDQIKEFQPIILPKPRRGNALILC